jgi:hypothetical protein
MTITQNTTNDLIFYAASSLTSPYYLVRLVNQITNKEFSFIVTDLASCSFIVAEMTEPGRTGSDDAINGTIKLDTGFYYLYLYDQVSSSNLDYTLSNELLLTQMTYVYSDEDFDRNFL